MWAGAKYSVSDNLDIATGYYHYIQNDFLVATKAANCIASAAAHSQCGGTLDAISGVDRLAVRARSGTPMPASCIRT